MRIHISNTVSGAGCASKRSATALRAIGSTRGGVLLSVVLWVASGVTPVWGDDAAERRLREDRERFQREIDRQTQEAKGREAAARAAASEAETAQQMERLRTQQAAQEAKMERLRQQSSEREAEVRLPRSRNAPFTGERNTPAVSDAIEERPGIGAVPDFSVTLLADGTCVVHRKGRAPEVKTATEALEILRTMVEGPIKIPAADEPSKSKDAP